MINLDLISDEQIKEIDAEYCSFGDTVHYSQNPKVFAGCDGSFMYDSNDIPYLDLQMWYASCNFGYKNKRIHGTFIKSKTGSKKVILFSHGWKNNGLNDYACAGMYYHKLGYNVLVIDHFGHGESSGKHITFGFFDRHNIKKWVDFINDRFNNDCKIFMHGLSMGSSIVTWSCADKLNNVCGIIADSGFCEGYELAKHIVRKQIKFFPDLVLFNARVICRIFAGFDIKKCNTSDALKKSKYPILFMHGDKDDFVPTKHSIISYDKCTGRKEIVIFDDCEHIISCLRHPEKYKEVVIKFIEKY